MAQKINEILEYKTSSFTEQLPLVETPPTTRRDFPVLEIKIHPDVLEMYFIGNRNEAKGIYLHEWFHVKDFYTGYANYIYSIYGTYRGGAYLEMNVTERVYNIDPALVGQIQWANYIYYWKQFYLYKF
jgi:hypothetical protein